MFEKVNPSHPDKIADRIAGAIVDLAYKIEKDPKIAVEVLIGHGKCTIIAESSVHIATELIIDTVYRIIGTKNIEVYYTEVEQDKHLAENQVDNIKCGDNGIFKGVPVSIEENRLSNLVKDLYNDYSYDGKFIYSEIDDKLIICQSNVNSEDLYSRYESDFRSVNVNPLGDWTGGINVDSGATNRKLGSDMGQSVTGGGLHGKDLSKADVSLNIYAWLKAQELGIPVEIYCAIGDVFIDDKPYSEIVEIAREFIEERGGFEKFAEWGLI